MTRAVLVCVTLVLAVILGVMVLSVVNAVAPVAQTLAPAAGPAPAPSVVVVPPETRHAVLSDAEYLSRVTAGTMYLGSMAQAMTANGPEAAAEVFANDPRQADPLILRSRAIETLFSEMKAQGEVPKGLVSINDDVQSLAAAFTNYCELMKSGDYQGAVNAAKPMAKLSKRIYTAMDKYSKKHHGKRANKVAKLELTKAYVSVIDNEAQRMSTNP